MDRKEDFRRRAGKYFLFFFLMTFAILFFFPKHAQAAMTRQNTQNGFRISGTGSYDVWNNKTFRYYIGYKVPYEEDMDYKAKVTLQLNPTESDMIPEWMTVFLGDHSITLYPNGTTTAVAEETFREGSEFDWMEVSCILSELYPSGQYVDFSLTVELQENRSNAKLSIDPPENNYEKTTRIFHAYIEDPYIFSPTEDASKYSVSISDPSVAKISSVKKLDGECLEVQVYFLKKGSANLVLKYGNQSVSSKFTVAKTKVYVPSAIALRVGDSPTLATYITKDGGGNITIKKLRSSNRKVVDVLGGFLIAKKTGTAKVTAIVNGQRKNITVTVGKKSVSKPKPTAKQIQVSATGYKYYPDSRKMYIQTRIKNQSKRTITKMKLRFTIPINESVVVTKTFTVNVKAGKTKTMSLYVGNKLIDRPTGKVKVKCVKFWYK